MNKVGIFGGTFDPIHEGHLAFAHQVIADDMADSVVFLPEATPRNKKNVSPIQQRISLIEQMIGAESHIYVLESNEAQFSVRSTIPELSRRYNGAGLSFLIGSDVALNLKTWENIGLLVEQSSFLIGLRKTETVEDVRSSMEDLSESTGRPVRYEMVKTEYAHLASSQFRTKI